LVFRLMTTPEVLVQVFFAAEANTGAAFAVLVRTHAADFRAAVLPVDFALVAEETARIGEAADVVAFWFVADVGAGVLVHMLTVILVSSTLLTHCGDDKVGTHVHSHFLENTGGCFAHSRSAQYKIPCAFRGGSVDLLLLCLEFELPPTLGTILILGDVTTGILGLIIAPGSKDRHEDVV